MLNIFVEIFLSIKYPLIGLFIILAILSFYWIPIFNFLKLKNYNNVQRVHDNEVARMGGLVIYLFFWVIYFSGLMNNNFFLNIIVSALPIVLISLKEDLFHNTFPKNRLILMITSCLIFLYLNPIQFPVIDLPYLEKIISYYPLSIVFFTFAVLVVINGMNLIDGMNGLFSFTALIQLLCISLVAFQFNDINLVKVSLLFCLPLLIFLLFNFPLGKIFIGDLGAYLYGFINSYLVIYLFGKYNLLSWSAVLILLYPCLELLFSYIRKYIENKSPMLADDLHLHSIINERFKKYIQNKIFSNSFTTIILIIFWLFPGILALIFIDVYFLILLSILIFIGLYIALYCFFRRGE